MCGDLIYADLNRISKTNILDSCRYKIFEITVDEAGRN